MAGIIPTDFGSTLADDQKSVSVHCLIGLLSNGTSSKMELDM